MAETLELRKAKPAQVQAMQYAFRRSRIALFMEMRLGKNLVTIRWAKHHQLDRVLVVAPNDVLDGWRDELILEGVRSEDIFVLTGSRLHKFWQASEIDTGWCIVNYEAIRGFRRRTPKGSVLADRVGAELLQLPWSGIVLDESTAIRNPGSQTTKTFLQYTGHILHRAILTGLPNPQSEMDFFGQMAFLHGSFMGFHNFWGWRHRHFLEPSGVWDWQWLPKKGVKAAIKAEVHKTAFFLSRKDAGVGETRVFEKRYITMTPRQKKLYQQVERDFAFGDTLETNWATVKHVWMARIAGGFSPDKENPALLNPAKIQTVVNLLKTELANEPVVIWFRFNQELFAVAKALTTAKIPHTKIVGGNRAEVTKRRQKFQTGKVRVILMQVKMGRFGWDLSRADTEIRFSETYNYEEYAQSRDRIVSVHKHTPLLSISIICKDTIDEAVTDVLREKGTNARTFRSKLLARLNSDWTLRFPANRNKITHVRRHMPGDDIHAE